MASRSVLSHHLGCVFEEENNVTLRHVRRASGLILTSAALVVLAGCGGSSKGTPAASPTNGAANIQAYVSCLNKNGVTIALPSRGPGARPSGAPNPRSSRSSGAGRGTGGGFGGGGFGGGGFGGGLFNDANNPPTGVSQATWTAALAACKSLEPTFNRGGTGGGFNNSQFTAYRNCLQSHGVRSSGAPGATNTADPKVAAALKTCQPLRPTGRPTGTPSTNG